MFRYIVKKLGHSYVWKRIGIERLAEPLHLNLASLPVALFGSFRTKVALDLVVRQQHAFCLLAAADQAKELGVNRITALEFGVANGAGLVNICTIAKRVTAATGVEFDIAGFDTGKGMPPPRDYRDHPEHYRELDYPMQDRSALEARLPLNARLVVGDVTETVPIFLQSLSSPVGIVSIDVDYYWSTVEALRILGGGPEQYLPMVLMYFDDIGYDTHSIYAGELLAIEEFNRDNELRKITQFTMLRQKRVFQRAKWIEHVYGAHMFDHPARASAMSQKGSAVLTNYYL